MFYLFKYNQQDAMSHNGIYYHKCSTCFRRLTAIVSELELTHDSGKKQKKLDKIPDAVYTVLSSWWWVEELPETCRAFIVIKTIV
jgi:hypothetical protein